MTITGFYANTPLPVTMYFAGSFCRFAGQKINPFVCVWMGAYEEAFRQPLGLVTFMATCCGRRARAPHRLTSSASPPFSARSPAVGCETPPRSAPARHTTSAKKAAGRSVAILTTAGDVTPWRMSLVANETTKWSLHCMIQLSRGIASLRYLAAMSVGAGTRCAHAGCLPWLAELRRHALPEYAPSLSSYDRPRTGLRRLSDLMTRHAFNVLLRFPRREHSHFLGITPAPPVPRMPFDPGTCPCLTTMRTPEIRRRERSGISLVGPVPGGEGFIRRRYMPARAMRR